MTLSSLIKQRALLVLSLMVLLFLLNESAYASSTGGGGLPFDSWLTKISNSITGPFAFAVAVVGMVASGAALIFGGDMNGVMRTLIFMVLVLSLIVGAKNMLSAITGRGALIGSPSVHLVARGTS